MPTTVGPHQRSNSCECTCQVNYVINFCGGPAYTFQFILRMRGIVQATVHTHKMANKETDNSLYPIAVLIDELRSDDVNVSLCEVGVGYKRRNLREWFLPTGVGIFEREPFRSPRGVDDKLTSGAS